jgi:16S rRNA (guanine527-N7)-methyltransferase
VPAAAAESSARPPRVPLPTDAAGLPALPDSFHETLHSGLATLAVSLSGGQLAAVDAYVRLLLAWTAAINLTAIREPVAVARDHIVDSLTALATLREHGAAEVLDLGSGGGLPGIPLAIALPASQFLLVESVGKKAAFLRTAIAAPGVALEARVEVASERAEDLAALDRLRERFDAVTVRAVAALPELVELAFPLLRVGGRLIAWKRAPMDAELAAGRNAVRALGGRADVVTVTVPELEDRRLVVMEKTRPTPRRYPRPPVERRRSPL